MVLGKRPASDLELDLEKNGAQPRRAGDQHRRCGDRRRLRV